MRNKKAVLCRFTLSKSVKTAVVPKVKTEKRRGGKRTGKHNGFPVFLLYGQESIFGFFLKFDSGV